MTNIQKPSLKASGEMHFFMEFPAAMGAQGNTTTLIMNVPARTLTRLLASDNTGHTLDRSQRELNERRVVKFEKYLLNAAIKGIPFIIPPLVGNCDCAFEIDYMGNTSVGIVRFPMDAVIKLFDGQHRAEGIKRFIKQYDMNLSVPIMLTNNLDIKTRQQFFSDINNNVSKPAAAINMVYDGRDDIAQMMVEFTRNHSLFSLITDYEHNVVPAKSSCFVSFKALCDATAKFVGSEDKKLSNDDTKALWEAWALLTGIGDIRGTVSLQDYRRDYIQFHAVMVVAYGYAVSRLLLTNSPQNVISSIEKLALSADTWTREQFFLISNWGQICADTDKPRPSIIASSSAQKGAAEKLVAAIQRGNFEQ